MVAYICQCYFLNSSHPLLSLLCPKSIFCVCLHSFPVNRFISTVFLESIYVLINKICFSDLLHPEYQALGSSTSLQLTQIYSFSWLSNIPLCICTTTSLSIHLSIVLNIFNASTEVIHFTVSGRSI